MTVDRKEFKNNVSRLSDYVEEPALEEGASEHDQREGWVAAITVRTLGGFLYGVWSELHGIHAELKAANAYNRRKR